MRCILILIIFGLYLIAYSDGKANSISNTGLPTEQMLEQRKFLYEKFKRTVQYFEQTFMAKFLNQSGVIKVSPRCVEDTKHLIDGLYALKPWALRLVDSNAKFIDGILLGTLASLGSYEGCLNTVASQRNKVLFEGKYCSIMLRPPLPSTKALLTTNRLTFEDKEMGSVFETGSVFKEFSKMGNVPHFLPFRVGLCVPSGCTKEDVEIMTQLIGEAVSLTGMTWTCEVKKQKRELSPSHVFVIIWFAFIVGVVATGSLLDTYAYYTKVNFKSQMIRVLLAFSLLLNFKKLIRVGDASKSFRSLNGVRFLCMCWIILCHTYFVINFQIVRGLRNFENYAKDLSFQLISNSTVDVDTFFLLSGLLLCYFTVKFVKFEGYKFNFILYMYHRLWRTYPLYIHVLMLSSLMPFIGSGPMWNEIVDNYIAGCEHQWWKNILFLDNFLGREPLCLGFTWYIACDFQFHVSAAVILLSLMRWPKVGITMLVSVIIASMAYSGIIVYINDYSPTTLVSYTNPLKMYHFITDIYFKPFLHAGPYCVGMLAGYLLVMKPNLRIPLAINVLGWVLSIILNMGVVFSSVWWNRGVEVTFWPSMIYASFYRVAWALSVGWIIVACVTGNGGVINYILSWKAFTPLSRLGYATYLTHFLVQLYSASTFTTAITSNHLFIVWLFLGNFCVSHAVALVLSLFIEAPFLFLESVIFSRPEKKSKDVPSKNTKDENHGTEEAKKDN